jgi:hypothetical protein
MTFLAFLCVLLVLFVAGLPLALLVRPGTDGRRVLMMPVIGLCTVILFTCFLASWGMTGRSIARIALAAIAAAGAGAVVLPRLWSRRLQPYSLQEFQTAAPALCIGLFAAILVAWPLFVEGFPNYWGFGNPDQPYYMNIVGYLDNHAFGQPPFQGIQAGSAEAGNTAAVLGLSYLFPMVSIATGIPSMFLFDVLGAAMIFLAPPVAYLLCRSGLALSPRVAAISAFLVALSAVMAQTFYYDSLGALAVAVLCPAGLALAALYTREPEIRTALLLALLLAGTLFCYFPGFAILGVLLAGWFLIPLLKRKLRLRELLVVGGLAIPFAVVYPAQSRALFGTLIQESASNRLAAVENELLLGLDPSLTENFVPSAWGLKPFYTAPLSLLGPAGMPILFIAGAALFAISLAGLWKGDGIPSEFTVALAAIGAVVALYFAKKNGYGVYKLITWIAPLIVIAFGVSTMALYRMCSRRAQKLLLLALLSCAGLNLIGTIRLGRLAFHPETSGGADISNVTPDEVYGLEGGYDRTGHQPVFAALQDQVLQRWATVFLPGPQVQYLPLLELDTQDSDSGLAVGHRQAAVAQLADGYLPSAYLLSTTTGLKDIVPAPNPLTSIWHNGVFAIMPLEKARNQLVLGAGWYRRETYPAIPPQPAQQFRWLRKRAEMLLLNPSPTPQRLYLKVVAGYGNPSPTRHLSFLVDGRKFDETAVSGEARFVTQPFTATGRVSHLEIVIQEDAQPIPRRHFALWNRWVPLDARRLNLGVFEVSLEVPAAEHETRVDFTSAEQVERTWYDGVYPDQWVAGRASIDMRIPGGSTKLRVRGMSPGRRGLVYPMRIRLGADSELFGEAIVQKPGEFDVSVPVPASFTADGDRDARVTVQPESNCFTGTDDTRCLTVRLERLSFEDPSSPYQKLK